MSRRQLRPSIGRAYGTASAPPRATTSRSSLDAALAYARAGWPVLPVAAMSAGECGCRQACGHPAKHPLTRHGVHDATTDPVLIEEWWRRSPRANVGIATGAASGLAVVDVDLPRGGRESLRSLVGAGFKLPATLRSRTGGGGLHLFYVRPWGVTLPNSVGRLPPSFHAMLCAAPATGLGEPEATATIRSGLRAGMAVPRRRAPEISGWQPLRLPARR